MIILRGKTGPHFQPLSISWGELTPIKSEGRLVRGVAQKTWQSDDFIQLARFHTHRGLLETEPMGSFPQF